MRSDDLSSLFGKQAAGAAQSLLGRQGLLVSFNPDGTNIVQVGQTTLSDVPFLLTGSEVDLSPGDSVQLLVMGNSYGILGKWASPGGPTFGSTAASVRTSSSGTVQGFALATSQTGLASCTVTAPPWANHYAFTGSGYYCAKSTSASDTDMFIGIGLSNGNFSGTLTFYGHAGSNNGMTLAHNTAGAITPGTDLTATLDGWCASGFTATAGNTAVMECVVQFNKQ